MIFISHDLVPDIVGSGVGGCRDGCGIRLCGFGCGAESVLHRTAVSFSGFYKLLRGAGVGKSLCCRHFGDGCCLLRSKGIGERCCSRDGRISRVIIPATARITGSSFHAGWHTCRLRAALYRLRLVCRAVIRPCSVGHFVGYFVGRSRIPSNRQFLIARCISCICCLITHIVGSGNKVCDVAACSGGPVLGIRLFVLHRGRHAGELSVIVGRGCAVHRGCCCGRVRCRFSRRRGQRDLSISGRCSGNRDLSVVVTGYGYSVDCCNTIIIREIIAVIGGINHGCHCAGQVSL